MSVLAILLLLALSHVDLSQSLHLNPTANNAKSSRIYNAQGTATPGQFPFQAYIIVDSAYLFGGALISSEYVLTSAAAVDGYGQWNVTLGMTDLNAAEPYRDQQISNVAVSYSNAPLAHSVGLIKLPVPVSNEFIRPAFLPTHADVESTWAGTDVTVTGFGYEGDGGPPSEVLKYAAMTVIPHTECQTAYSGLVSITAIDLCATGNGNPCSGDNGSPLFIDNGDTTFKIIGVHTFGWASCVSGHPAGFNNLASAGVLNWISQETGLVIQP